MCVFACVRSQGRQEAEKRRALPLGLQSHTNPSPRGFHRAPDACNGVYVRACVRVRVRVCVRVRVRVRACVCARVRVCVRDCVRAWLRARAHEGLAVQQ